MYCVNCGREIADGSTFCTSCGAKQAAQGAIAVVQSGPIGNNLNVTMINQATVDAIYHVLEPLKRIAEENEKIDTCQRTIKANEGNAKNFVLNMILGFVIGFMPMYILWGWFAGAGFPLFCGLIGTTIGFLISSTSQSAVKRSNEKISIYLKNIDNICMEVDEDELSLLPPSYRFYNAAAFFYNAFINQRALTMQQAVNLYEDEMRKDEIARIQQQQMAALKSIRTTSTVSATMSTLNFVSKLF